MAVNPATNKIYVANFNNNSFTVIDGTNNFATTIAAGTNPFDVAVNPISGKVYVPNSNSANVTVITPAPTNAIPLNTAVTPVANNTVNTPTPTFTLTATTTYAPTAPQPQNIYFQIDTLINPFLHAAEQSRTATTLTATATTPALKPGLHILYFFASDGSEATSINPARPVQGTYNKGFDSHAPESSAIIGGINAYVFLYAPLPPVPTAAISRKVHGNFGAFDINLPLTGTPGIECRSGGASNNYETLVTFALPVTLSSVSVTSGTGSVSGVVVSGANVFVNLTGVTSAQTIAFTLFGVSDGTNMGNVVIPMGVLVGDTNGSGSVNATDVSQTKSQSGQAVNASNFRNDVIVNGSINATDVSSVKSKSGTALP